MAGLAERLALVTRLTAAVDRLARRAAVGERGRRELRALLAEARAALLACPLPAPGTAADPASDPADTVRAALTAAHRAGLAYPELVAVFNDQLDRLDRRSRS